MPAIDGIATGEPLNLLSPEPRSKGTCGRFALCCRTADHDSHRLSRVFGRCEPVHSKLIDSPRFFCRKSIQWPTTNLPMKNLLPVPANESQIRLGLQDIRLGNRKGVEASQVIQMTDRTVDTAHSLILSQSGKQYRFISVNYRPFHRIVEEGDSCHHLFFPVVTFATGWELGVRI